MDERSPKWAQWPRCGRTWCLRSGPHLPWLGEPQGRGRRREGAGVRARPALGAAGTCDLVTKALAIYKAVYRYLHLLTDCPNECNVPERIQRGSLGEAGECYYLVECSCCCVRAYDSVGAVKHPSLGAGQRERCAIVEAGCGLIASLPADFATASRLETMAPWRPCPTWSWMGAACSRSHGGSVAIGSNCAERRAWATPPDWAPRARARRWLRHPAPPRRRAGALQQLHPPWRGGRVRGWSSPHCSCCVAVAVQYSIVMFMCTAPRERAHRAVLRGEAA